MPWVGKRKDRIFAKIKNKYYMETFCSTHLRWLIDCKVGDPKCMVHIGKNLCRPKYWP